MNARLAIAAVCRMRGMTIWRMLHGGNSRVYARPRHEAAWLMRVVLEMSFPGIGAELHRDHSTIIDAVRAVQARVDADPAYGERLRGLLT